MEHTKENKAAKWSNHMQMNRVTLEMSHKSQSAILLKLIINTVYRVGGNDHGQ